MLGLLEQTLELLSRTQVKSNVLSQILRHLCGTTTSEWMIFPIMSRYVNVVFDLNEINAFYSQEIILHVIYKKTKKKHFFSDAKC